MTFAINNTTKCCAETGTTADAALILPSLHKKNVMKKNPVNDYRLLIPRNLIMKEFRENPLKREILFIGSCDDIS